MVLITIVTGPGVYKPTYITGGAPPCGHLLGASVLNLWDFTTSINGITRGHHLVMSLRLYILSMGFC